MNKLFKIIGKYALILSIFYLIQLVGSLLREPVAASYIGKGFLPYLNFVIMFILNIITAIIVSKDISREKVKSKYIVALTVVFRPLGVVLLLLSIMNMELMKQQCVIGNGGDSELKNL